MSEVLDAVVGALTAGKLQTMRAYPGNQIPELTGPSCAVSIGLMNEKENKVMVTVLSPAVLGGSVCENAALKVGSLLENMGSISIDGPCYYDARSDLFYMKVFVSVPVQTAEE